MFLPELHTSSWFFDIFMYICCVMENKTKLPVVKYVWVVYEFSTGEFFVYRKKLDLVGFLESNTNTFNYRWNKNREGLFWENKYVIKRAQLS